MTCSCTCACCTTEPPSPLSLEQLSGFSPSEIVFDVDGHPWLCQRTDPDPDCASWVCLAAGEYAVATAADLHADRSPLTPYRLPPAHPSTAPNVEGVL